ncbi:MAG: hypothetical protein AAF333_14925 [Planctomycetota bacterium]
MPATVFKRKDTVVKAVRRHATVHLDAVIAALSGASDDRLATAERELRRLAALLELVRRPLGGEVFQRERRTPTRALKAVAGSVAAEQIAALKSLAAADPPVDVDDLVKTLASAPAAGASHRKPRGPDPAVLRLLADLAEMRMRARYWHLPAGEFELLAPGLRASYQRARRLAVGPATRETAEAWGTLADQVQNLERAWPELLAPLRKELRAAERQTRRHATLLELVAPVGDHDTLRPRLDAELAGLEKSSAAYCARLLAETPVAFAKRLNVYWDVWRGVGG